VPRSGVVGSRYSCRPETNAVVQEPCTCQTRISRSHLVIRPHPLGRRRWAERPAVRPCTASRPLRPRAAGSPTSGMDVREPGNPAPGCRDRARPGRRAAPGNPVGNAAGGEHVVTTTLVVPTAPTMIDSCPFLFH
jgi:hypothetical protein